MIMGVLLRKSNPESAGKMWGDACSQSNQESEETWLGGGLQSSAQDRGGCQQEAPASMPLGGPRLDMVLLIFLSSHSCVLPAPFLLTWDPPVTAVRRHSSPVMVGFGDCLVLISKILSGLHKHLISWCVSFTHSCD